MVKKAIPAAKKAAPAVKSAPAKVAAPAPAPVEAVDEGAALEVGTQITFIGYDEGVAAEDRILTDNTVYEIVGFTEAEGEDPGGDPIVRLDNPNFNPKKRETDENPKTLDVAVFPEEFEVYVDDGGAAEPEPEPVAAPAPAAKKTVAAKAAPAAKTAAKPAAKTAAPAPAKKTAKAAPVVEPEVPAEDPDAMPDLEGEDEEVLALVNGERDLIEVAQELEATASRSEYQLGGVLFHIKKAKSYVELDATYAENNGWALFLKDYFNVEYRKAQYLIQIYIAFTQAQIENPADAVAKIGWAKAQKISVPMMVEGADAGELIELAEANTVVDLATVLKEQVSVGGTPGTKVSRITMKFRFLEEEGASINAILEAVKEAQGLKTLEEAVSFIVNEWASHNGVAQAKAKSAPAQKTVAKSAPAKRAVAKV